MNNNYNYNNNNIISNKANYALTQNKNSYPTYTIYT